MQCDFKQNYLNLIVCLKAQSDYIEAKDKNDYVTMSRLQVSLQWAPGNSGIGRQLFDSSCYI